MQLIVPETIRAAAFSSSCAAILVEIQNDGISFRSPMCIVPFRLDADRRSEEEWRFNLRDAGGVWRVVADSGAGGNLAVLACRDCFSHRSHRNQVVCADVAMVMGSRGRRGLGCY